MPQLIKNGAPADNPWVIVPREENLEAALARPQDHLLVPVQLWLDHPEELAQSGKQIAVWLDADQHPEIIAAKLHEFPLIALNFPKFSDGRSFSHAVALRKRFDYKGEVRAIGDVLRDPLFYMKRCGFDSFDLSDEVKLEDALTAFGDFQDSYQSSVELPMPLFRRAQREPLH